MRLVRISLLVFYLLFTCIYSTLAQEPKIFKIVEKSDIIALKAYLDTSKTSINIVNSKGYSPLHVLIDYFVDYKPELIVKSSEEAKKNVQFHELDVSVFKLLLEHGASVNQRTPEGWNALQYAVVKGKWKPVDILLDNYKGGNVRDEDGNTLLHLGIIINPDEPRNRFWEYLVDKLRTYDITISTPNSAGQTPISFYMSFPRCKTNQCPSSKTYDMLDKFIHHTSLMVPDFSGKTSIDYAKMHNSWAVGKLEGYMESYRRVQAEWEPHLKQFVQQAEENKRKIQEYEARKASEAQSGASRKSGCKSYCNTCQGSGMGKEKAVKVECPVCYGRGTTGYSKSEISGFVKDYTYYTPQTCYKCNGSGRRTVYEQHFCGSCRGSGCAD
jgi:hypothetical protein